MSSNPDRPQLDLSDREQLQPEDLTGIDLAEDEVIRVMVVQDDQSMRSGAPLLTGHESCATHDTTDSALAFINDLYENPGDALDDMDLKSARDFTVKPRRDTVQTD